jgi:phospholipid-translocating ATPase
MTTLPITVFGLFERHLPERLLLDRPELYKRISRNVEMKASRFLWWIVLSCYHAAVIYFATHMLFGTSPNTDVGQATPFILTPTYVIMSYTFGTADHYGSGSESTLPDGAGMDTIAYGMFLIMCVFLTVTGTLAFRIQTWTWPIFVAFGFTIFGFFALYILYQAVFWKLAISEYFVFMKLFGYPAIWLYIALVLTCCWLPNILIRTYDDTFSEESRIREDYRRDDTYAVSVTNRSGQLERPMTELSQPAPTEELYENCKIRNTPQ